MKNLNKLVLPFILFSATSVNAAISLDNSISGSTVNDFSTQPWGDKYYVHEAGASYSEKFLGQTVTDGGSGRYSFDVLSGNPVNSLTLESNSDSTRGLHMAGYRQSLRAEADGSHGTGSFAVLLDAESDVFGFELLFSNGAELNVDFFANDGTLIDHLTVTASNPGFYGFKVDNGDSIIRGVSLWADGNRATYNLFDNFTFNLNGYSSSTGATVGSTGSSGSSSSSTSGSGLLVSYSASVSAVPEPKAYAMMLIGVGLVGFVALRRNGGSKADNNFSQSHVNLQS